MATLGTVHGMGMVICMILGTTLGMVLHGDLVSLGDILDITVDTMDLHIITVHIIYQQQDPQEIEEPIIIVEQDMQIILPLLSIDHILDLVV